MIHSKNSAYGGAALALLAACLVQFHMGDAGDKEWQLYAARQLVLGHRLYVDTFFDVNSPLLVWIYTIPSFIALHVPWLTDAQAMVLMGFSVIAGVIALSVRLIELHPGFTKKEKRLQCALLLAFIFIFYTNIGYFFHREQIFLLLSFPYLLRNMPSLSRRTIPLWLTIVIGIMAGIGFCMKPYCLIIPAGVQLIVMLRERSASIIVSVENLLVYAVCVLYVMAVWYFTPEYLTIVLPMAFATYRATNRMLESLIFLSTELFLLALPLADFRLRYASAYRRDIFYLLLLTALFFMYALLNNGWGYTYNLVNSIILLTTGFLFWEYDFLRKEYAARGEDVRPFLFGIRACLASFLLNAIFPVYVALQVFWLPCENDEGCKIQQELMQEVTRDGRLHSFSALSIEFTKWTSLTRETGAPWESRFPHLWMLPKFFAGDDVFRQQHQAILDYVAGALADELNGKRPEVIFVDDTDRFFIVHKHIELIPYLSRMPEFTQAFAAYHYAYSIDECKSRNRTACKYDVYRRD